MKTCYVVTKKQIIEAVLTEPLIYNRFVHDISMSTNENPDCGVCAVGAVLRKAGLKNRDILNNAMTITKLTFSSEDLEYDLDVDNNNFLSILSMHHEYFASRYNSKLRNYELKDVNLQRMHLLSVIEAFCPEVVTFEIVEKEYV